MSGEKTAIASTSGINRKLASEVLREKADTASDGMKTNPLPDPGAMESRYARTIWRFWNKSRRKMDFRLSFSGQ